MLWFVLGFAFYSTLYGSLGSLASRTEDAQAAAGPLIALLVSIYALAFVAMANPGAGWVTIVSMLPPSAPIIMPLRTALVNVPAWQIVVAVILMLAAIYGPVPRRCPALPQRGTAHRRPPPPARSLARRTGAGAASPALDEAAAGRLGFFGRRALSAQVSQLPWARPDHMFLTAQPQHSGGSQWVRSRGLPGRWCR